MGIGCGRTATGRQHPGGSRAVAGLCCPSRITTGHCCLDWCDIGRRVGKGADGQGRGIQGLFNGLVSFLCDGRQVLALQVLARLDCPAGLALLPPQLVRLSSEGQGRWQVRDSTGSGRTRG